MLTGGAGGDRFVYEDVFQAQDGELITDLDGEDVIDLKAIDADITIEGDQRFHLVSDFTQVAGQMTLTWNRAERVTTLQFDVDGDGVADGEINIAGKHVDFTNFAL